MKTQEILDDVLKLAPIINEGKKAFTESIELKCKIVEWYANHGTKLSCSKEVNGFYIWNPAKFK